MKYLLLFSSMALAVAGQIFLKKGILPSSFSPTFSSILKTLFSPLVFFGLFLLAETVNVI